jgi:hypothetical protein
MRQTTVVSVLAALGCAALGFAAPLAAPARAQSSQDPQPECHRCLGGFRFLPSSVVGDPFATTYFDNATGGGMALDLKVPVRNIAGETVDSLRGNVGFLLVDFTYQKAVARWLALRAGVTGIGRVGTSTEAVVASGASAAFSGGLGATVPLWSRPQFLVSAAADYRTGKEYEIDPYTFVRTVVDEGYSPEAKAQLLGSEKVNRWSLGLRGAWAVASWIGLSGVAESGFVDKPTTSNKSLTTVSAQAGFDLLERYRLPLGISLGYRGQLGEGRKENLTGGYRTIETGLYYTGRPSFQIGGEALFSRISSRQATVPDLDAMQFRILTRIDF